MFTCLLHFWWCRYSARSIFFSPTVEKKLIFVEYILYIKKFKGINKYYTTLHMMLF